MAEGERNFPMRERYQVVALRMKMEGYKVVPTTTEPFGFYVKTWNGHPAKFADECGFIEAEKAVELFKEQL